MQLLGTVYKRLICMSLYVKPRRTDLRGRCYSSYVVCLFLADLSEGGTHWIHLCLLPKEVRRGIGFPGTEILDGCELPCGTGTQTQVLCKSNMLSSILSSPCRASSNVKRYTVYHSMSPYPFSVTKLYEDHYFPF